MNHKLFYSLLTITSFLFLLNTSLSFAQNGIGYEESKMVVPLEDLRSFYATVYTITGLDISIPTVAELDLETANISSNQWALWNTTTESFEPFNVYSREREVYRVVFDEYNGGYSDERLSDDITNTQVNYPVSESFGKNNLEFTIQYDKPIFSNTFTVSLDEYVRLPDTIQISSVQENADETILLAKSPLNTTTLNFPQTYSANWKVEFTYSQPLRISDMKFLQKPETLEKTYFLRFLAQPNTRYNLYAKPSIIKSIPTPESGNLSNELHPYKLRLSSSYANPLFSYPDQDNDGLLDHTDNCPTLSNPDQLDINKNIIGDACEDFDLDGIVNSSDNCPDKPNRQQQDEDGDGYGDSCDPEESRLTEQLRWLPWAGILISFTIVFGLLAITVKKPNNPIDKQSKQR